MTRSLITTKPDTTPRFAYEHARDHLDNYARRQDFEFRRAYMKMKFMAAAYAYADYFHPHAHYELAMARGWEELQIAFTGRGEAFLSGAVLHLWNSCVDDKAEKSLHRAVVKAFQLAEKETPREADRLYLRSYREAPIRNPDSGFTLEPVLPVSGIRLREWAVSQMLDPDVVEEQFAWVEYADRMGDDGGVRRIEDEPDAMQALEAFAELGLALGNWSAPDDDEDYN